MTSIDNLFGVDIPPRLLEVIKGFPVMREVRHCDATFEVCSFDIQTTCPECRAKLKARSFSAVLEVEDVFDAVLEWLDRPGAEETMQRRRAEIRLDRD